MKPLKSSAPPVNPPIMVPNPGLNKDLIEFEADFLQYRSFKMAKEALYKKDILGASQLIRTLKGEIVG